MAVITVCDADGASTCVCFLSDGIASLFCHLIASGHGHAL